MTPFTKLLADAARRPDTELLRNPDPLRDLTRSIRVLRVIEGAFVIALLVLLVTCALR